ncbi:MAG: hypothetical protein U0Q07_07085 [Acidimicrobiales bacterium]
MTTTPAPAVGVAVIGFDPRNQAAIELFFDGPCHGRFRSVDPVADPDGARAVLIDVDSPVGRAALEERVAAGGRAPAIAVSLDADEVTGVTMLRKPLKLDDLRHALDRIIPLPGTDDAVWGRRFDGSGGDGARATDGAPSSSEAASGAGERPAPPRWDADPRRSAPPRWDAEPASRPERAAPPRWDAEPAPRAPRPAPRWDATPDVLPTRPVVEPSSSAGSAVPAPAAGGPLPAARPADLPRATGTERRFAAPWSEWEGAKDLRRIERREQVRQEKLAAAAGRSDRPARLVDPAEAAARRIRDDSLRQDAARSDRSTHHVAVLLDEQALQAYVGAAGDIDPADPAQVARATYHPDEQLQGVLEAALRRAVVDDAPVRVWGDWGELRIDPKSRTVVSSGPLDDLRPLCHGKVDPARFHVETLPPVPIEHPDDVTLVHGWHALAWDVALWCSRGRIPAGTDLHAPIVLEHWPDLTRLTITPHAVRIVAAWMHEPRSLVDLAAALEVEQRSVFAVYSAARAIGLARPGGLAHLPPPPVPVTRPEGDEARFIGRLLKRLRKG